MCGFLFVVLAVQWCSFQNHPRATDLCSGRHGACFFKSWRTHWGLWLISVLETVNVQLPVLIVRTLLDAHATALFFAALKIASVVALPLLASGPVVAPQISRAWAAHDFDMLQRIGRQTALFTGIGTLIGVLAIIIAGEWFLRLFGADFAYSPDVLLILAAAQFLGALLGPTGFTMLMIGHERVSLLFLVSAAIVAVFLMIVLTIWVGLIGAAVGVSSLLLINKICCYWFIWNKYNLHLSLFGFLTKRCPRSRE